LETTTLILLAIIILCFLCGFYFLYNIELCKDQNPIKEYPKVSIIIPSRNEEHNIGKLLSSINNQKFKVDEVIVVNDSSIDRTKEIAENYGVKILESMSLPEGWMGKPWACWQGAQNTIGDIFLFLDADTIIEPDGMKKIIDSYLFENSLNYNKYGVVLSVAPFHKIEKLYEEFSALFNIIMVGSMNAFTPLKDSQPTGLFGQSLILSRNNYFEIEGHSSVKNKILENVFMARKFKEKGIKLKCLGGKGTLSFRMYPDGFKALVNGWTKAFAAGAGQTPISTLLLIIFWLSAGFIITIKLVFSVLGGNSIIFWILLYLAFALQMYWMLRRIGTFKLLTPLFFPINLLFYVIVFFRSLYYQISKKTISWKSREVRN
jgi:4,4'-diaponeurosporenoate glycosyltransferase